MFIDHKKIKEQIIKELLNELKYNLEINDIQYNRSKANMIAAPNATQSRHDTSKMELSYHMEFLYKRRNEIIQDIEALKGFSFPNNPELKVLLGSLIKIDFNDTIQYYFLFTVCGGEMVNIAIFNNQIKILSPYAPLSKKIIGKQKGDISFLNNKRIHIIEVS